MKNSRITIIIILLLSAGVLLFAEGTELESFSGMKLTGILIDAGLFENEEAINLEALNLSLAERLSLYDEYEISAGGPFLLNTFLQFGIGSYVQGDTSFAIASTIADTVCNCGIFWNFIRACFLDVVVPSYDETTDSYVYEDTDEERQDAIDTVIVFLKVKIAWDLFEAIRPFIYKYKYNTTLENALRLNEPDVKLSFSPFVDLQGNIGFGLGFSW